MLKRINLQLFGKEEPNNTQQTNAEEGANVENQGGNNTEGNTGSTDNAEEGEKLHMQSLCAIAHMTSTLQGYIRMKIYNHYRKHWLGAYWQDNGITVIPTISWSDKESFGWCFDGELVGGTVAVSSVYVTLDYKDEPKFITYYSKENKRSKQIDLDNFHKGVKTPHTHHGYNHSENDGPKGATNVTPEERKMVERIKKIWYNRNGKM